MTLIYTLYSYGEYGPEDMIGDILASRFLARGIAWLEKFYPDNDARGIRLRVETKKQKEGYIDRLKELVSKNEDGPLGFGWGAPTVEILEVPS